MGAFAAGAEFFVPEHVELKRAPQLVRKPAGSVLTRMSESVFVELKLHGGQGDLRKTGGFWKEVQSLLLGRGLNLESRHGLYPLGFLFSIDFTEVK